MAPPQNQRSRPGAKADNREVCEGCDVRVIHLEQVNRAKGSALDVREVEALSRLFKALGDPTRLRLITALRQGRMCVCDLAAALGMTESAVSHQLRHLRGQALVRATREGQVVYYTLEDEHVEELYDVGLTHVRE